MKLLQILRTAFCVLSCILLLLVSKNSVYANDCNLGRDADSVYPMQDTSVVMVSEDIHVDVEEGFVECNFVFKNTGGEKEVLMGFPARMENDEEEPYKQDGYLRDFKTYIAGEEIPSQLEEGIQPKNISIPEHPYYSHWYTFNVHFKAGETKKIKNTYKVTFRTYSGGHTLASYIIQTGAFWKDPIGHAKVTFNMGNVKPCDIDGISPNGFRFEGTNLVWENKNFEPTYDLEVMHYNKYFREEFVKNPSGYSINNEYLDALEDYQKLSSRLDSMTTEEKVACYYRYQSENKPIMALYLLSKLPEGSIPNTAPEIKEMTVLPPSPRISDTFTVKVALEDPDRDLVYTHMKIFHEENGKEIVDYDQKEMRRVTFMKQPSIECSFSPNLLEGTNYTLQFSCKDTAHSPVTKTMKYPEDFTTPEKTNPIEESKNNATTHNKTIEPKNTTKNSVYPLFIPLAVFGTLILGIALFLVLHKKHHQSK